jgi:hypothetical protein
MITSQAELKQVKEDVAKVRSQGKSTICFKCGNSDFVAMGEVLSRYKNLATLGIIMASCRHGCIFTACDMSEGEKFRHTLVAHMKCSRLKYKFLVNDVICKYWPFVKFLEKS